MLLVLLLFNQCDVDLLDFAFLEEIRKPFTKITFYRRMCNNSKEAKVPHCCLCRVLIIT